MPKGKAWYGERSYAKIPIATNNLIICCGAETEKNYFAGAVNYFSEQEENRLLQFYIVVDAVDPMGMAKNVSAKTAFLERENHCKMDHVWVVFDKDDFPAQNFNNAIKKIRSLSDELTKYHVLWSNQCFELWLLLNFINMQAAIDREAYIEKLEIYLKEKYQKNDKNIFGKIALKGGNIVKAIDYAKALIDETLSPASNDPATTVYEFFEHFRKYLGLWE